MNRFLRVIRGQHYIMFKQCHDASQQSLVRLLRADGTIDQEFYMIHAQKLRAILETIFRTSSFVAGVTPAKAYSSASTTVSIVTLAAEDGKITETKFLQPGVQEGTPFCLFATNSDYPHQAYQLMLSFPMRCVKDVTPQDPKEPMFNTQFLWHFKPAELGLASAPLGDDNRPRIPAGQNEPSPSTWLLFVIMVYWEYVFHDCVAPHFSYAVEDALFEYFYRMVLYQTPFTISPDVVDDWATASERARIDPRSVASHTIVSKIRDTMQLLAHKAELLGHWCKHQLPEQVTLQCSKKRTRNAPLDVAEHKNTSSSSSSSKSFEFKARADDCDLLVLDEIRGYADVLPTLLRNCDIRPSPVKLVEMSLQDNFRARMMLIEYLKFDCWSKFISHNYGGGAPIDRFENQWVLIWDTTLESFHHHLRQLNTSSAVDKKAVLDTTTVAPLAVSMRVQDSEKQLRPCVMSLMPRTSREAACLLGWIYASRELSVRPLPTIQVLLLAPHVARFIGSCSPYSAALYNKWARISENCVANLAMCMEDMFDLQDKFPSAADFITSCYGLFPFLMGTDETITFSCSDLRGVFAKFTPSFNDIADLAPVRAAVASSLTDGATVSLTQTQGRKLLRYITTSIQRPDHRSQFLMCLSQWCTPSHQPKDSSHSDMTRLQRESVEPMQSPWLSDMSYHATRLDIATTKFTDIPDETKVDILERSYDNSYVHQRKAVKFPDWVSRSDYMSLQRKMSSDQWPVISGDWCAIMCIYEIFVRSGVYDHISAPSSMPDIETDILEKLTCVTVCHPVAIVQDRRMNLLSAAYFPICGVEAVSGPFSPRVANFLTPGVIDTRAFLSSKHFPGVPRAVFGASVDTPDRTDHQYDLPKTKPLTSSVKSTSTFLSSPSSTTPASSAWSPHSPKYDTDDDSDGDTDMVPKQNVYLADPSDADVDILV